MRAGASYPSTATAPPSSGDLFALARCKATGVDGPTTAREIADRLVAAGLAIRAPDPPSLATAQLVDQCHLAEPAQRLLGDHWIAYFDP